VAFEFPSHLFFEFGERRCVGGQRLQASGELCKRQMPNTLSPEERTEVQPDCSSEPQDLVEGETVHDLLIEAFKVVVRRVRDAKAGCELPGLPPALLAGQGKATGLVGLDEVSGFDGLVLVGLRPGDKCLCKPCLYRRAAQRHSASQARRTNATGLIKKLAGINSSSRLSTRPKLNHRQGQRLVEAVFVAVSADLLPRLVLIERAVSLDHVGRSDSHAGVVRRPRPADKGLTDTFSGAAKPTTVDSLRASAGRATLLVQEHLQYSDYRADNGESSEQPPDPRHRLPL
jgi:hypothetical protein